MRLVISRKNIERIRSREFSIGKPDVHPDTYRERLIKYIPSEVIVLYVAIYGIIFFLLGNEPYFSSIAQWILIAGVLGTPLYLWKIENVDEWVQLLISTIGFLAWVFAFGVEPVSGFSWYNQVAASLFLPIYIFASPLVDGKS
jgi:hypothetical protein